MIQEDFSVRLKKAMELRKIKASELSKRTNISPPMISDYLKGKYKAKQNNIYQLAKVLNVNEAWLMGYDTSFERIPDELRGMSEDEILLQKITQLTDDQKKVVIDVIDNMK